MQDLTLVAAGEDGEDHGSTLASGTGICRGVSCSIWAQLAFAYLLGGSCLFPRRLSLLRATGSKSFTSSCDGGGTASDDDDSTSRAASDDALRHNSGGASRTAGLASLERAVAVRKGSSRKAMLRGVGRGWSYLRQA